MKKSFLFIGLIGLIMSFASCDPNVPQSKLRTDAQKSLNTIVAYYPYSINDEFVYVNETTGEQWKGKPYSNNYGEFPEINLRVYDDESDPIVDGEHSMSYGSWNADVYAEILEVGVSHAVRQPTYMHTTISKSPNDQKTEILMSCYLYITFNKLECYLVGVDSIYSSLDEVMAFFTDTIVLQPFMDKGTQEYVEGSYARIIRDKGLTDFSVDGKTVRRRVHD